MNQILVTCLLLIQASLSWASNGCVDLDGLNFDKVVKRFQYSLVKFDVAFPYGDKHEAFTYFAKENSEHLDHLLFALVGIKDYGEKENADLGKRFNVKEAFPDIKLFNNDSLNNFIDYPENLPVTVYNLREFISSNTDLYIGLPGCLKEIDELAAKFALSSNAEEMSQILSQIENLDSIYSNTEKLHKSFNVYLMLMKKILQSEKTVREFITSEEARIQHLLSGKLSENKKADLNLRLNIMKSFKTTKQPTQKGVVTDEL
ncbi:protein windbeutel isoform X2 [Toxorhynchites rutilus septentrionalis]|nr:protein windbeutel isoform X2 [Toxorhynchites rutilus septentrionalis]XP_055618845.1 protein windbeutel isoform X2 [Toxorhynchites rutilus septentrionalis]